MYAIDAVISGPDSFGGMNGKSHVESSGVTFKFEDWLGTTGWHGKSGCNLENHVRFSNLAWYPFS